MLSFSTLFFFLKKIMKQKILQNCSLKHSIKKGTFEQTELFNIGQGEVPLSPPYLREWMISI